MPNLALFATFWIAAEATHFYKYFAIGVGVPPFFLIIFSMLVKSLVVMHYLVLACGFKLKKDQAAIFTVSLGVLVAFPIFQGLFFRSLSLNSGAFWLNNWLTFAAVFCLLQRDGKNLVNLLGLFAILSLVGVIIGYIGGDWFLRVAKVIEARPFENYRALGFFVQPNSLGISIVIGILILFISNFIRPSLGPWIPLCLYISIVIIVLSGSRVAMGIGLTSFAVLFLARWKVFSSPIQSIILGILALFISFFLYLVMQNYSQKLKSEDTIMSRVLFFNEVAVGDRNFTEGRSVSLRLSAFANYLKLIEQRPILGWGTGSEQKLKDSNKIILHSHSSFMSNLLEFGLVGVAILYFGILYAFIIAFKRMPIGVTRKLTLLGSFVGFSLVSSILTFAISYVYLSVLVFLGSNLRHVEKKI